MPLVYLEYKLCEKFGWTLEQLYSQPWEKIDAFLKIMQLEAEFEKRDLEKLKAQTKKYARR